MGNAMGNGKKFESGSNIGKIPEDFFVSGKKVIPRGKQPGL
jgi:hypothetical protein